MTLRGGWRGLGGLAGLVVLAAACGGSDGTTSTPAPDALDLQLTLAEPAVVGEMTWVHYDTLRLPAAEPGVRIRPTWRVVDTTLAWVDSLGRLFPLAPGRTRLVAGLDRRADTLPLSIAPRPAGRFAIEVRLLYTEPERRVRDAMTRAVMRWQRVLGASRTAVRVTVDPAFCSYARFSGNAPTPPLDSAFGGLVVFTARRLERSEEPVAAWAATCNKSTAGGGRAGLIIWYQPFIDAVLAGANVEDLDRLLEDVYVHELGHLLGLVLSYCPTCVTPLDWDPTTRAYVGPQGVAAWQAEGAGEPLLTADDGSSHWADQYVQMSGSSVMEVSAGPTITRTDLGVLRDRGFDAEVSRGERRQLNLSRLMNQRAAWVRLSHDVFDPRAGVVR